MSANNDLRVEVRETIYECLVWVKAVRLALEAVLAKADDREARINFRALGKFVNEADDALRELETLVDDLLASEVQLDTGDAAAALEFYADPKHYAARRNAAAEVMADGGKIARLALAVIRGEDGEENGE